jgi:hypothetical protein
MEPVVDLVYFNAGGGHRAAALALQDMLQRQQRRWQCAGQPDRGAGPRRATSAALTGLAPEDLYNRDWRVAGRWAGTELKLLQGAIRLPTAPV